MATKKVGSTGRWGPRYGRKIKQRVAKIEEVQKGKHECPSCLKPAVKRLASGIWECRKCERKMCGGSYAPRTGTGQSALKNVSRR